MLLYVYVFRDDHLVLDHQLECSLGYWLGWAASKPQGYTCFYLPSSDIARACYYAQLYTWNAWDQTWVLMLPWQALYPLSHIPSPVFYFKNFRGCLRVCNMHLWLIRVHFQILSCLTGNASSLYQFPVPPFHPFSQRWRSLALPKARKQNTFPF